MATVGREQAYTTPRPDVFEMVPPQARAILDVGCSNGALGASLRHAVAGRQVWGVELDPDFAAQANQQLDGAVCADVSCLDWTSLWPGQQFDCIVFADVLEHLPDPAATLQAARQRLAPGGCMVVSLPNIRHLSALRAIYLGGRFPQRDRGIFDRTHLRWFTLADAYALMGAQQLQVRQASYAMRLGDQGGGRINRWLNRLPPAVQGLAPLREFLTYQFCLQVTPQ
jgi:trans-aconitate methyltransferase